MRSHSVGWDFLWGGYRDRIIAQRINFPPDIYPGGGGGGRVVKTKKYSRTVGVSLSLGFYR